MSEAMVLAADDGSRVALLDVEKTEVGEEVKFEGLENSSKEITFDEFLKVKMEVVNENVAYKGRKLVSEVEEVSVLGVNNLARVR